MGDQPFVAARSVRSSRPLLDAAELVMITVPAPARRLGNSRVVSRNGARWFTWNVAS